MARLKNAALALILAGRAGAAPARPAVQPLNIVVIDICSARADRFGAYGHKGGLTPSLDAFAAQSATFTDLWAQSSWCLPNYATLLTGHRPEVHGLYTNLPFRGLPAWEQTVPQRLREAGYRTGAFTAGVYTLPEWGLDRGFDVYVNNFSTAEPRPGRFSDTLPDIERWIDRKSSAPFFLYATVDDLHSPYQSDEDDAAFAGPAVDTDTLSVAFFRAYNGEPLAQDSPLAAKLRAFRESPAALPALRRRYEAALSSTDRSIARFFDSLKARGLWDKTLIVITSDHGELLGEHGLLGHTEGLYEPILRVPAFVRHPGRPASYGTRLDALTERVDFAPTFLESAGVSSAGMELQGRSLLPLLDGAGAWGREVSYASSKRNLSREGDWTIDERAVRDARWKLLWSLSKDRWELYDLLEDPAETRDLAAERPEQVARLSFQLMKEAERARSHAPGRPSGRADAAPGLRVLPARDR